MNTFSSPAAMFVVYISVFVGILLAFDGMRQILSRKESVDMARNRRMRMVNRGADSEELLDLLVQGGAGKKRGKPSFLARARKSLHQARIPMGFLGYFVIVAALTMPIFMAVSNFVSRDLSVLASILLATGVATLAVKNLRKTNLEKLAVQLPDALDLMARGLQVGHPLNVTVASVATDMPDPIGSEFGIIQDQISYGDDLVTAFADFAERVEMEDARYLAVSIGIQHGTGGNLARVLQILSKVIRDRATMRKRILAISAEGRLSAVILTALPFLIFGTVHASTPTYYSDVSMDPLFRPLVISIVGLVVGQAFILNRLVNFKF